MTAATFLKTILLVIIMLMCIRPARSKELSDKEVLAILAQEKPRDKAIRKGLVWLRTQQQKDGQLGSKYKTAMTSFGIMAHLAAGVTFNHPEHGKWLKKSLRAVLAQQDKTGYYGKKDGGKMYGHGVTTLMLAEALGMIRDEELEEQVRKSLELAVALTVKAALVKKGAAHTGGWRYSPTSTDSDMSLSGWQMMSLHAAQQVGITVPAKVIKGAYEYAKRNTKKDGRVGYQNAHEHSKSLRGLGMFAFAIGGDEKNNLVTVIGQRILNERIAWRGQWFFYRAYYDSVGLSRARPEMWKQYAPLLEKILTDHQGKNGSWSPPPGNNEGAHGQVYMTSMAILALAVNRHVLPAYQR